MYFWVQFTNFLNEIDFWRLHIISEHLKVVYLLGSVREIKSRAKGKLAYKNFLQNWSFFSKLQAHFSRTTFLPKLTSVRIFFSS